MNKRDKATINRLVADYQRTFDETSYERAYDMCRKILQGAASTYSFRWSGIPLAEFESECNLTFHIAVHSYKASTGDFENLLRTLLSNKLRDLVRRERKGVGLAPQFERTEIEEIDLFELSIFDGTTKDSAKESHEQLMQGKRVEIVNKLLEGVSPELLQTVQLYAVRNSMRQVAIELGVSTSTVKRRLEKLAKRYDAKQFGDIHDYLEGGDTYAALTMHPTFHGT